MARGVVLFSILTICAPFLTEIAAQGPVATPRSFVTRHSATFNGQRVSYAATVGETLLNDERGHPTASLFSIAYVRDDVATKSRRPVIFAFNGGPGSASLWLHMGALGPKRVALPDDLNAAVAPPYKLIDNSYAVLDVADIVFIDPVETGYSRVLPGAKREDFYTAAGDAKSISQFIRAWTKANGRGASPKYVLGESYGTIRSVLVADQLAKAGSDAKLDGVILLGQAVNIVETVQRAGNVVGYAVNLPVLTAIAWYHDRIDKSGKTLDGLLDDAYTFAIGDYLSALAKGRDLPEAERSRIAQRLAGLTGLSAAYYLAHDLVISKERYRLEILKDKGLIVGRNDARYTGPVAAANGPGADPSAKMSSAFEALVKEYLTNTLQVKLTEDYRPQDRASQGWDYGGGRSPFTDYDFAGAFGRLMRTQANLRLMVGTGLYDTTTTTGATRYLLARNGFPADRVRSHTYEGGHMFYTNQTALKAFTDDLRAFVVPPSLNLMLHPVREGGSEVTAVEAHWQLDAISLPKGKPFSVRAPITYAGRTGIADRVDNLVVQDASGPVPLKVENDPVNAGGFPYYRHWRTERAMVPPIIVTYRMRSFTGTATTGPQFDFYSHAGGLSSGGMALLVLPEDLPVANMRVKWDLTDLATGSIAASTYGEGDFDLRAAPEQLAQAYYMAGPLGRYVPESSSGFRGYWLGQAVFDPQQEMAWTHQAYEYLRKFYRDTTTSSYRMFIRALPGTGGGTALQNSFMLGTAPGLADPSKIAARGTLAHEMGHYWIGGLTGGGTGGTTWFNEGLNVYYTRLLLLRSGLAPVSDYLGDINQTARAYYTNSFRNLSADELDKLGFSKGVGPGSAQNVPYARGSLFFADIDAKIRAGSGGHRKLDDVILALFDRRRGGEELSPDALVDALAREIGPASRQEFDSVIIRGETIIPESGAFGPCFERHETKFQIEGKDVVGYEWVRVPTVPDDRCREW